MNKINDKLAIRLAEIIIKLNSGEQLTIEGLANEFNVSERTIRRDLTTRLISLPLERKGNLFALSEKVLGKLTFSDIKDFALISGIDSLFPDLTKEFILEILNNKINNTILIKNQGFEDISSKSDDFKIVNLAIQNKKRISYFYNNKKRDVNPYKLVNNNGTWYLVADENNQLKTYTFSKMKLLRELDNKFKVNSEFIQIIEDNKLNWFTKDELIVTLELDNSITEYFFKKNTLANYTILEKSATKTIISTKASYENEILGIVKYWIPHIRIISPIALKDRFTQSLLDYLENNKN